MAKTYSIPELDDKLLTRIANFGYKLERKSRDCIKLMPIDEINLQYKRYYVFHIDFTSGEIDGMNMSEHVPGYKRATIWVKPQELELMLDVRKALQKLLSIGELLP